MGADPLLGRSPSGPGAALSSEGSGMESWEWGRRAAQAQVNQELKLAGPESGRLRGFVRRKLRLALHNGSPDAQGNLFIAGASAVINFANDFTGSLADSELGKKK